MGGWRCGRRWEWVGGGVVGGGNGWVEVWEEVGMGGWRCGRRWEWVDGGVVGGGNGWVEVW